MSASTAPHLTTPDATPGPGPAGKKHAARWGVLAVVAVAIGACGIHWWRVTRFQQETDDAYVGGDVTVVGSKVSGYITELRVGDNQVVRAGDLLARIDPRDYQAALLKAGGAMQAQEAALANLQASAALQQALIAKAKAGVAAAEAETTRARDDARRYADLVGRSAVSVESAQHAGTTLATAEANLARARAEQQAAERQLDVIASQRRQVLAWREQARAEQQIAQLNLSYTDIRAPRDGVVGNRKARVGAYVSTGSALLAIVPASGLWVDANFKEDQLGRMKTGQRVSVRVDALPDEVLHGRLGSLAPATGAQFSVLPAENATGNFTKIVQRVPVRIELDAADARLGRLRPGLSAVVQVDTAPPSDSMAATTTASAR